VPKAPTAREPDRHGLAGQALLDHIRSIVRNPVEAEDVLQEVLVKVSPRWPLTTVLLWDVALSMLFFLQRAWRHLPRVPPRGPHAHPVAEAPEGRLLLGGRTRTGLRRSPDHPHRSRSAAVAQIALPAGIALLVLGVGLMVSGIVALGRNLAAVPRPKQGATLVERGPCRVVRHAMHTGAILIAFGWALAVTGTLSLAYAGMVVWFLAIKTAREERWLREELTGYPEYERRVRRLIPFVY
jgi:protein-S-isoprenylcysteine O-methyltransferase Ste14